MCMKIDDLIKETIAAVALATITATTCSAFISVEDVPDMHVNSIAQDRQGYMWIGTDNGLFRFNGSSFISDGLPTDKIRSLVSDPSGRIWISSESGLFICSTADSTPFQIDTSLHMPELFISPSGVVCCGSGGLWVYEPNSIQPILKKTSDLHDICVFSVSSDSSWGGTHDGERIVRYNGDFEPVSTITTPDKSPFMCMSTAPDGSLWIGRENGLLILQDGLFKTVPTALDELMEGNAVTTLIPNGNQMYICISNRGIVSYDFTDGTIIRGIQTRVNVNKLSVVNCGLFDNAGKLWVGTADRGLGNEYNSRKNFNVSQSLRSLTRGKFINCVTSSSDGSVAWVGSSFKGILGFEPATGTGIWYDYNKPERGLWIDAKGVNTIACDATDALWYNKEGNTYVCSTSGAKILSRDLIGEGVVNVLRPIGDAMWGGGPDGLFKWENRTLTAHLLSGCTVSDIARLKDGRMLVSTSDGLKELNAETMELTAANLPDRLDIRDINCILPASDGSVWIGTGKHGLIKLSGGGAISYSTSDGLGSMNVSALAEDHSRNIWVTTVYGMSVISPEYGHLVSFPGSELSSVQHFTARSITSCGDMFLCGGNTGVLSFRPEDIMARVSDIAPTVILSGLRINDVMVEAGVHHSPLDKPLDECKSLVLPYKNNSFEIIADAISFAPNLDVTMQYRLTGKRQSTNWTECGADGAIPFYSLRSGTYSLEIKAVNGEGFCNPVPRMLEIVVKTSIWLTVPMILLYLSILCAILLSVLTFVSRRVQDRMKLENAEKELKAEKELSTMKLNFFGNISHELRTYLTLIYSPVNMLAKAPTDEERNRLVGLVNRNTGKLVELVDQLLMLNRIENSALPLSVSEHSPSELITYSLSLFETSAIRKNIELSSVSTLNIQTRLLLDSDKIAKILSNLLSNAIKYTPEGGKITVRSGMAGSLPKDLSSTVKSDQWLVVSVEDNGIGMKPSEIAGIFDRYTRLENAGFVSTGSGIGLHYTSQLVKMHNGSISAKLNADKGMTFTFAIPTEEYLYRNVIANGNPDVVNGLPSDFVHEDSVPEEQEEQIPATTEIAPTTRILLVEDNQVLSEFINSILCPKYEVFQVYDGMEALDMVEDILPDLVITDVMMPRMDGLTLSKRIKKNSTLSHIPIIILTAKSDEKDRLEGYEAGADIYLTKPFNSDILRTVVDNMVTSRERMRRNLLDANPERLDIEEAAQLGSRDRQFLSDFVKYIDDNLSDGNVDVLTLSDRMCLSRSSLFRKVRSLTGMTPNAFVNNYRLNKAAKMLKSGEYRVSEVCDLLGFKSASYFSKAFKQRKHPKKYILTK